jgi:hypothetical protein
MKINGDPNVIQEKQPARTKSPRKTASNGRWMGLWAPAAKQQLESGRLAIRSALPSSHAQNQYSVRCHI